MMIAVALDGSKRRDLKLYSGDTTLIEVSVYRKDGDEDPIADSELTDMTIKMCGPWDKELPVGTSFEVPKGLNIRNWYTLSALVSGVRTTLAFGWILPYGQWDRPYPWGNDYGWRWPFGPGNCGVWQ